jgi:hypothetical protein
MPIPVIALLALAVFFGVGVLLVVAMFFENRKKTLPGQMPNLEEPVSQRKPAA